MTPFIFSRQTLTDLHNNKLCYINIDRHDFRNKFCSFSGKNMNKNLGENDYNEK